MNKEIKQALYGVMPEHEQGASCLFSGGGGGGNSTTTSEIPKELKPLAKEYSQSGVDLFNSPFEYYDNQRYADLTQPQMQGIDMVQNRALGGSATNQAAEAGLNQFIQGGNTNPFLDQMFGVASDRMTDAYSRGTAAQTDAAFARSGAFGGSAHNEAMQANQTALGDSLAGLAANMYGGAYDQDRSRQMQAIGMAPQLFGNMAYQDASQLLNAGQILQDQAQNPMDFAYQQFQGEQNKPYQDMAAAAGIFQSQPYGQSSTTKQSGGGK